MVVWKGVRSRRGNMQLENMSGYTYLVSQIEMQFIINLSSIYHQFIIDLIYHQFIISLFITSFEQDFDGFWTCNDSYSQFWESGHISPGTFFFFISILMGFQSKGTIKSKK